VAAAGLAAGEARVLVGSLWGEEGGNRREGDAPIPCWVGLAGDGVGWDGREEREEEGEGWG
jgi:hypothetical protein